MSASNKQTSVVQKKSVTLVFGRHCHVQRPRAVLRLGQIDEVLHAELHHLLYLQLVALMDALQQAVDLQDLQAALCYPATHDGVGQGLLGKHR